MRPVKPARSVALAVALCAAAPAAAHQLNVFASTDCETVLVEAKFSSGAVPVTGDVRISGGDETLLATGTLGADGTLRFSLSEVDASAGLMIEVAAGNHGDYWILTPEDIARQCRS